MVAFDDFQGREEPLHRDLSGWQSCHEKGHVSEISLTLELEPEPEPPAKKYRLRLRNTAPDKESQSYKIKRGNP